ncbi:MAG: phosphatase PAP2 family protein [Bacilli bacterium]|nr:phosphatase PAP2 family protein [Bacilli bacterium]
MKKKKNIIICICLTLMSIIYTILVKNVDVKNIGPNNTSVGFSTINNLFKNLIGSDMKIYKITEIFGLLVFIICLFYGIIGIYQLIKRKSIKKVDKEIILMGIFYIIILFVYALFEKLEINYRPILIDGKLEASYPSSHTILALCVCISSLILSKKYINKKYINITNIITLILLFGVFIGRIMSGVHWISDIIGGIIISFTLIMYYITINNYIKNK